MTTYPGRDYQPTYPVGYTPGTRPVSIYVGPALRDQHAHATGRAACTVAADPRPAPAAASAPVPDYPSPRGATGRARQIGTIAGTATYWIIHRLAAAPGPVPRSTLLAQALGSDIHMNRATYRRFAGVIRSLIASGRIQARSFFTRGGERIDQLTLPDRTWPPLPAGAVVITVPGTRRATTGVRNV